MLFILRNRNSHSFIISFIRALTLSWLEIISLNMMLQITILAGILSLFSTKLIIQSPQELVDAFNSKYKGGEIPYSIANYGIVPYGKTISGQIGIPSVLEDCVFEQLPDGQNNKKILLVERNDCTFTQKSLNVQKEGGKLAMIIDSRSQDVGSIVMVDDGRGFQVTIPSILISHEDGQLILNALEGTKVVAVVSFDVVVQSVATLQIWTDISQHSNFVFLRNFLPYFNKIKNHVKMTVAYPTRKCPKDSCLESDCFYNYSYCRTNYKYSLVEQKGQKIIKEQLRQYVLFQLNPDKWWDYVLSYDQTCTDLAILEECSSKIMKKMNIDSIAINRKVEESFEQEDNPILNYLSELKYNNSIAYYPSVVVNNVVYRGSLQPFEVHELICESLSPQPEGCEGYKAPEQSLSSWIIFVIVSVTIFGLFLIVCFRRLARRQISEKINNQVNELVNQYITMYQNERFQNATQLTTKNNNKPQP